MKKQTYINQLRQLYTQNREMVLLLTGMTEVDLYTFQIELFSSWLDVYNGYDSPVNEHMIQEDLIWKWWVNEWHLADHNTILPLIKSTRPSDRYRRYKNMHQLKLHRHRPTYELLESSYREFVKNMTNDYSK